MNRKQKLLLSALHPELRPYAVTLKNGGLGVVAPFANIFLDADDISAVNRVNQGHLQLKALAEQNRHEKNWSGFIWNHERQFHLKAFDEIAPELSDEEYWKLLREVWTYAETIWRSNFAWLSALRGLAGVNLSERLSKSPRQHPELFMTPADRDTLQQLPETFTIYRGYVVGKNSDGFSWTLDRSIAERLSKNGKGNNLFDEQLVNSDQETAVREKTAQKENIFAYTNARSEQEIILLWWEGIHWYEGDPKL
jgi:hypothetical protein